MALIEWTELSQFVAGISAFAKGEPGGPKLALLRELLLATWHDLSEVRLVETLDDFTSFRRFDGFPTRAPPLERTSFVRIRA